jgi:hypothetical protein
MRQRLGRRRAPDSGSRRRGAGEGWSTDRQGGTRRWRCTPRRAQAQRRHRRWQQPRGSHGMAPDATARMRSRTQWQQRRRRLPQRQRTPTCHDGRRHRRSPPADGCLPHGAAVGSGSDPAAAAAAAGGLARSPVSWRPWRHATRTRSVGWRRAAPPAISEAGALRPLPLLTLQGPMQQRSWRKKKKKKKKRGTAAGTPVGRGGPFWRRRRGRSEPLFFFSVSSIRDLPVKGEAAYPSRNLFSQALATSPSFMGSETRFSSAAAEKDHQSLSRHKSKTCRKHTHTHNAHLHTNRSKGPHAAQIYDVQRLAFQQKNWPIACTRSWPLKSAAVSDPQNMNAYAKIVCSATK